jgi:hypothetical protein
VTKVTAADIESANGVVSVRVGQPSARIVRALDAWTDEVVDLAETAVAGEFLVGGKAGLRAGTAPLNSGHASARLGV